MILILMILVFGYFAVLTFQNIRHAIRNGTIYVDPRKMDTDNQSNETQHNPATGLPMIGALDTLGNSMGSSASDSQNHFHNDYHISGSRYSSSYDPFTNRY